MAQNHDNNKILVIDSGGTTTRMAIWDGEELHDISSFPTKNYKDKKLRGASVSDVQKVWIADLAEKVAGYRQRHNFSKIMLAMAGPVTDDGTIIYSHNIWGDEDCELPTSTLSETWKCDVTVINDMTAAAARYGKDPRFSSHHKIMSMTISSGIGAKVYDTKHKEISLEAAESFEEIGLLTFTTEKVFFDDKPLSGVLERYCSGNGIVKLAEAMAEDEKYRELFILSALNKNITTKKAETFPQKLLQYVDDEDAFAIAVIKTSIHILAKTLKNIIVANDPDVIVLMGGLAINGGERYRSLFVEEIKNVGI
ncbi:MAG: ROK family protein, partial [Waddliaceae bacterium]|nr:ROK family protein [Waddliaceae bacterium]